ncbi:MAG: phosphoribosylformylglycinamidine synthase subunit PurL [Bdellovibrionaceae bacterium]|nr:phosphoribosylformylglycinamidine synthase subunit PurL [Pseudobdellovibrionaceae bacterium]
MNLEEKISYYRLNKEEYNKICDLLGREPQGVEWALFSALWSEHCSYKSSRRHFKKFFAESPRLVEGFGENAGVIDLGEGERVGFKMESHNHPSFIEPYQGAATGVGGILRDIFTMGARPIALGNYLCFGRSDAPRMQDLVSGVVSGIAGYGNCVGVPNVTGQTEFHSSYDENILVNAFALGYFGKEDVLVTSKAKGEGNYVVYVGAKTGRDGIHGASMASESFEDGDESKRPTVQIGDPFFEKLLIESCLDVINQNLVVAIQDMGAAGLTSSSFEMSSKGGVGLDMSLDQVPLRDASMSPEDILLSESQERMLLVCLPEKFEALKKVFHKWNLEATKIGEVVKDKKITLRWHGEVLTSLDPDLLVENSPNYERKFIPYSGIKNSKVVEFSQPPEFYLRDLFTQIQATSRQWIYRQYDQRVGANTARDCGDDVGVVMLPETQRPLGIVLGCRPALMRGDAYVGAQDAIFYPAIELALKGLEPLAVTDCLNYGNPEKENVMTDFVASIEGISSACRALKAPVISGNVSFYNETRGQNITPTPSTGLVGLGEDIAHVPHSTWQKEGDVIYKITSPDAVKWSGYFYDQSLEVEQQKTRGKALANDAAPSMTLTASGGSNATTAIATTGTTSGGVSGALNVEALAGFVKGLTSLVRQFTPSSSKIVGKYGLLYTLFKMNGENSQFSSYLQIDFDSESLFREKLYEVVLALSADKVEEFENFVSTTHPDWQMQKIGQVTKSDKIVIADASGQELQTFSSKDLGIQYKKGWSNAFSRLQ